MTRMIAKLFGAPRDRQQITAWMNYPYRNVWGDLLSGRVTIDDYWPDLPLLLVYGTKKPFPFHSDRWANHVRKVGGEVFGLDCGHWVTEDPAFAEILSRWLEKTRT